VHDNVFKRTVARHMWNGAEGGIRAIALSNCFTTSQLSNSSGCAPYPAPKFVGFIRTDVDEN
jgi:hypothetical protein